MMQAEEYTSPLAMKGEADHQATETPKKGFRVNSTDGLNSGARFTTAVLLRPQIEGGSFRCRSVGDVRGRLSWDFNHLSQLMLFLSLSQYVVIACYNNVIKTL